MSGFNNPVVGALNLIRKAIRSPNYDPGVDGWTVNQDGSAEFNDVTVRGTIVVGPDGMPRVVISQTSDEGLIEFPTGDATEADAGAIFSKVDAVGVGLLGLLLNGPVTTDNPAFINLTLLAGAAGTPPELLAYDSEAGTLLGLTSAGLNVNVPLFPSNVAVGTTLITPSAANTPTSLNVSYDRPLTGSTFTGFVSAATAGPGSLPTNNGVTGVGITSVTATGATLWVTRQNTTQTRVNYMVWGT